MSVPAMTLDDLRRPPPRPATELADYECEAWDRYYAAVVGALLRAEDEGEPLFLERAALLADGMMRERRKRR